MSEELAGGPGQWPRGARMAAAVAVAALVGLGGWRALHTRPTPGPAPQPTATPEPSLALPEPSLVIPAPLPTDFSALPPAGRTGVRLIVAGRGRTDIDRGLIEVDLDTGARRPVTGVPVSGGGYRLDRTDGGAVIVQLQSTCVGFCVHGTYVVPAGSRSAVLLPGYDGAAAAADPGLLWAYRATGHGRSGTVQLVDLAGGSRGPAYPLPSDRAVLRGTVAGLLTVRCCDVVELWDPRTGRTLRVLQRVIAASATRLAWVPDDCTFDCTVTVTDLPAGSEQSYPLHAAGLGLCAAFFPAGFGQCAAFSPDGTTLAVVAHRDVAGAGGLPIREVYLLSGDAVTSVVIHAGVVLPDISLALGWSGRRLVLATLGPASRSLAPLLLLATATLDRPELRVIATPDLAARTVVVR